MLRNNFQIKKDSPGHFSFAFSLIQSSSLLPPPLHIPAVDGGCGGGGGGSMFSLEQRPAEDRVNHTHILYTAHLWQAESKHWGNRTKQLDKT